MSSGSAQQLTAGVEATTIEAATPEAVAYDAAGNLYVALRNGHVVRKIDTSGLITTVAGTGEQGFSGDGSTATSALLDSPGGLAVDASGNLYIADSHNHRVRMVANGVITTVAGSGVAGFSGDNGTATAAQLNLPTALSIDASGNLYIADTNNQRIRKVSAGVITTVAGTGLQGFGGDGQAAVAAQLDTPTGVAADPTIPGRFYIADTHNQRIRMVDANGNISTTAGTGTLGFGGEGAAPALASLAIPRGLGIDASGNLYIADSGNQRIRAIAAGVISTVAGDGEQGFAGDLGTATSAILDTPRAVAVSTGGLFALADTHNQRVRSVAASAISTVAGIPPAQTEGLFLSGPTASTYGSSPGRLVATFTSPTGAASGSLVLNVGGHTFATAPISGNVASFDLGSLPGGLQTLTVSYGGDTANAPVVSGVYLVNVSAAPQSIMFPPPQTPVTYSPGLTATLAATASSGLPVTYQVTAGPATVSGSTLTYTGSGSVVVTATQAGNANYAAASATQTITVAPSPLFISGISPSSVALGTTGQVITVTGSGFTTTSVIRFNGVAVATVFDSTAQLHATLPQPLTLAPIAVTAYDPASQLASQSSGAPPVVTVTPAKAAATLNVPATSNSGQQPAVGLTLQTAYPVAITGTYTLSFTPSGTLGVDDPSIQFLNGSRTYTFTIPANTTVVPSVPFQTGTVAGAVTVSFSLNAAGVDVTPATGQTAVIAIPAQVPTATSVSFVQVGPKVTVTVVGFSNVRNLAQAGFNFTAAPGTSLATTSLTLPVTTIFNDWFSSAASNAFGSVFTYTQIFNLSDTDAKVQSISVTLTNSVGASLPASTP